MKYRVSCLYHFYSWINLRNDSPKIPKRSFTLLVLDCLFQSNNVHCPSTSRWPLIRNPSAASLSFTTAQELVQAVLCFTWVTLLGFKMGAPAHRWIQLNCVCKCVDHRRMIWPQILEIPQGHHKLKEKTTGEESSPNQTQSNQEPL